MQEIRNEKETYRYLNKAQEEEEKKIGKDDNQEVNQSMEEQKWKKEGTDGDSRGVLGRLRTTYMDGKETYIETMKFKKKKNFRKS